MCVYYIMSDNFFMLDLKWSICLSKLGIIGLRKLRLLSIMKQTPGFWMD